MARINSKKKGAKGEKQAIAFLKDWTGLDFARTPSSGGLRWKKAENIAGDIVCIEKNYIFPLGIEVKNHKDINFEHLLMDGLMIKRKKLIPKIKTFWLQAVKDSNRAEKIPMLLMRYDFMPSGVFFVVMSWKFFRNLGINFKRQINYSNKVVITTTVELGKLDWGYFEKCCKLYTEIYGKASE